MFRNKKIENWLTLLLTVTDEVSLCKTHTPLPVFLFLFLLNSQQLKCFNLRPTNLPGSPSDSSPAQDNEGEHLGGDSLSTLPFEVLCHMATFLDSLSLCQLALVSRLMRQVCFSLLHERGMVTLRWGRKACTQGRFKWEAKLVRFSLHFLLDLFSRCDSASASL